MPITVIFHFFFSFGHRKVFDAEGIFKAFDFFSKLGHNEITIVLPDYRKEKKNTARLKTVNYNRLHDLDTQNLITWCPTGTYKGQMFSTYDDR